MYNFYKGEGYKYKKTLQLMHKTQDIGKTHTRTISKFYKTNQFNRWQSLSKRDFRRVSEPLSKFGAKFKLKNNFLPLEIYGSSNLKPIKYYENKGSAQCKSSIIFAQWELMGIQ